MRNSRSTRLTAIIDDREPGRQPAPPVTNQVSSLSPLPTYDANGNQLTSTPATLTWNALNLPISVNSTTATYDALGRMVEKGSGGTYTQFVFSPAGAILAEYSGSLVKGTIPLPGGGTAIYNGSGLSYIRHTDWLGSSRLATTWAHAVYSKEAYAPFGETYYEAGTADRSFTGQDQDVVTGAGGTGVYDYLFRKYDPSAGRWLSPDPAGWSAVNGADPQSLNRYAYVENQPMSNTDPQGEWMCFYGSGVSTGLEVDPGMTCWSDGYGYSVEADSAGKFTFDDNGTITATISGTLNGQDYSYPLLAGYWTQIEGIPGITNGQTIFFFNGSGSSSSSGAPNSVINQAVQKFTVCLNTPGKAGWLATLGAIIGLQPDMPERPEGLNAQMGVSPSDGQVAPDPLMEQSLGASPGELGYNISAEKQCAKENPYVFLSPNVTLDILPGDVF
jgi:RHS repeat-associated protein